MTRNQLRIAAVVLAVLIVVVAAHALDHLPSAVRARIDAERAALTAAQSQLGAQRSQVAGQAAADPELFAALPFGSDWSARLDQATAGLRSAANDIDQLTRLEKRDRRSDRQAAETLLAEEARLRARALADAGDVQKTAAHWVDAAGHLAGQVPVMEREYQAIHAFDLGPAAAAVGRAATDWPEKRADLEARLASERALVTQTDAQWQTTSDARRQAAAGALAGPGRVTLLRFEADLESSAAELPKKAAELTALSTQLYTSWDKLLVDMQTRDGQYQQQIRTVRTHLADAAAKTGEVSSDEQWNTVPRATYDAMRNDLGMAIEHKPAGRYDSESEHVAQPAGMAYVAPFAQRSNQYGYWDHRDGRDFWVFYGQYALLRDLLSNHDYRPFDRYEWEEYRSYSTRGQTYYGRDASTGTPQYGSQSPGTQSRYSGSKYAHSGGFRDSPYAAKSGSYRNSQFASPASRDPNADHSPKTFGHSSPDAPPPARTYHRAPSPSPRPPSRSPGRSFGRKR